MLLDPSPASAQRRARPRGKRPGADRRWHPIPRVRVPAEPGRAVTIAAIQAARERRDISQRWHDGLETRAYALKRVLWRFRDGDQASGQYACSLEQLTVAIAPVVGWGPVPAANSADRARWFRAHRKSVQRWLDLLTDAGLVHVSGVRDAEGYWWRTIVTLLPHGGPQLEADRLTATRARVRGFPRRERARRQTEHARVRAGGPSRQLRHLDRVLADSARPNRRTRRRIAITRGIARHERRRRSHVDAVINAAAARRAEHLQVLTPPYGAPSTTEYPQTFREASNHVNALHQCSVQTTSRSETLAEQTRDTQISPDTSQTNLRNLPALPADETYPLPISAQRQTVAGDLVTEREAPELSAATRVPPTPPVGTAGALGELLAARVAAREAELGTDGIAAQNAAWHTRSELHRAAVEQRCAEVQRWPAGRAIARWRIREAWVVCHPDHGPDVAASTSTSAAGNVDQATLTTAIELYEASAAHRPPGWPASGAAALTVLAARGEAHALAGDVARLRRIARDMRATALTHSDPSEIARLAARTNRTRLDHTSKAPARLTYRRSPGRAETTAEMRRRQRALLIYLGQNPALFPNLGFAEAWLLRAEAEGEIPPGLVPPSAYAANRNTTRWASADTAQHQTGSISRADRYRIECTDGRWTIPDHWHAHNS